MRTTAALLIGTSVIAFPVPAFAQTPQSAQAAAADQSLAQTSGDDIIVTATKRASRVQDVPFSINAQTQEDIRRAHAQTIEDISRNVAGLTVQNLGPGQSQVSVRGVSAGQIVRDQPGVKEQVGIYLDESVVSLSLFTPDFDLFDLNRVETLRGPQGTLFGSGSVGGTIRYITNQPRTDRIEGTVEGGINFLKGGEMGYDAKGALNVPLSNEAALRMVAYHTHFGGFIDAVGPAGGKNVNDGHRTGTRVSFLWQPGPQVKITPRLVYQETNANGFNREEFYNLFDNQFTTSNGTDLGVGSRSQYLLLRERFHDKTALADLTMSYDFGPVEATSVTSKMWRKILVSRDASTLTGSITFDFGFPVSAMALPSNLRDTTKLNQFTQELRFASTSGGPFQWVFGGFYSNADRTYHQRLPTPGYDAIADATFIATCVPDNPATPLVNEGAACANPILGIPKTSAAADNGFGLVDNPYHADLPYTDKQKSLFGEASYKFGQIKAT